MTEAVLLQSCSEGPSHNREEQCLSLRPSIALECPREGVEFEAEVPLKELQPLIGSYRDEKKKLIVKVIIQWQDAGCHRVHALLFSS